MVPLANHRCVASDKSSSAAATARDHRPVPGTADSSLTSLSLPSCEQALHFVQLLQQLPEQASAAAADDSDPPMLLHQPGATATTEPTPAIESAPSCRSDRDRDPQRSPTSRQPSASTIDVDGDVGMTPEPLDRPPPTPDTTTTTPPSLPRRIQRRPPTLARTRFLLVPVTVAAANRANATARKIRGGPGPAVTPDAGPICPATS
ncbi:hypothetical protein MHU86_24149 [Fragilaria crotonensis]|nr:hypothetical protein MHU86_24149 [Fragilaria crotonensis]